MKYKIYYSKGMIFFGERAEKLFGFEKYDPIEDLYAPVLFLALYSPEDYQIFKKHQGKKAIFWNGSDVSILAKNTLYQEIIKSFNNVKCATHSKLLQEELKTLGIESEVRPIFFGNIQNYPISYEQKPNPEVYLVAHPGREKEYGLDIIKEIAPKLPKIRFHIYGIEGENTENIIFHGQVKESVMDQEIKNFQGVLRLNTHDGLSQSVIKSVLLGQYPITKIAWPEIWTIEDETDLILFLERLKEIEKPNTKAREYYLSKLNNFDWLEKEKEGISLVMVVKNEEKGLEKAILSCINFVDEIVISVDTKSTDLTLDIAKKYANILLKHEWKNDFSEIRNNAQQRATSKWCLILDGHEYVENCPDLKQILKLDVDGIFTKVKMEGGFSFYVPRIIRQYVKWVNPVHNAAECKTTAKCEDFVVVHDRHHFQTAEANKERTAQRNEINFPDLHARIKKDKKDARAYFYLAQQYYLNGKWKEVIKYYKKYLKYSKLKQQRWVVYHRMATCASMLGKPHHAIKFLKLAEKELPNRWENSKKLGANYMYLGKWEKAIYYFVDSFKINKGLFVFYPEERNDAQTWYFIGQCFFTLREYEKGKIAMRRALATQTDSDFGKLDEDQVKIIEELLKS